MRRSTAPSKLGAKFCPPLLGVTPAPAENTTSAPDLVENAARTTKSILGLIAKVKQDVEGGHEHCSEVEEQSSTSADVKLQQSPTVLAEHNQNHPALLATTTGKRVYNVVYGKPSKKKHKTWEGDGILEIGEKSLILKDCESNIVGRGSGKKNCQLDEGSRLFVGSKEVEIIDAVSDTVVNNKRPLVPAPTQPPVLKKPKVSGARPMLQKYHDSPLCFRGSPLVMPEPDLDHQWHFNKDGAPVSRVSVDYSLFRVLRPHQKEGITFLYRCITGLRDSNYFGAILADEMGLGKTLQCITLIWTLLQQGLYGSRPFLRKVLVVTPSSLTRNWHQEFLRWLGQDRIHIFVVDQKNKPKDFLKLPNVPVMIVSYEMFVRCYDDVASVPFDLIVCDEGHRLKNNSIRASTLLSQLPCQRRILLTGTPVQNDLQEFFALVNFVNPNVLGTYPEFRKSYEASIVASRQPDSNDDVIVVGESQAQELSRRTAGFILRRTHAVFGNLYLPRKHELVVFCTPSKLQIKLFRSAVSLWETEKKKVSHLAVITALRKICNHPNLLCKQDIDKEDDYLSNFLTESLSWSDESVGTIKDGTKLFVVWVLLHMVSKAKERIVLVSYFTQSLDLLEELCNDLGYKHCRLDGTTPSARRVDIVNEFNSPDSDKMVFLLSARAGGVGLNLTGASRLVLFDSDWNPASDLQALSRIWRDGQNSSVYIYRLLTTGSIEEKIFQRQLSKAGLNEAVVDPTHTSAVRLSDEELKDLFHVEVLEHNCLTHKMLPCDCVEPGHIPQPVEPEADMRQCQLFAGEPQGQVLRMNQLFQWEHHSQPISSDLLERIGLSDAHEFIDFIFCNVVGTSTSRE